MQVACPHCRAELECDGSTAGQTVACPQCVGNFTVPVPVAAVAKKNNVSGPRLENEIMSGHPSWLPFIPGLVIGFFLIPVFGLGLLIIIVSIWRRFAMKYVLTTKKLNVTHGIIAKNESSVRIKDIRGIVIKRDLFDALTGCGTVIVGTAATADAEIVIAHIKEAKRLQACLNELHDDHWP